MTVIQYKTKDGRTCKGVATNWLLEKTVTDDLKPQVPIFVRKSQFRLPFKFQTSVLMIGPGTGLAPFRGFTQERDYYRKEGKIIKRPNDSLRIESEIFSILSRPSSW